MQHRLAASSFRNNNFLPPNRVDSICGLHAFSTYLRIFCSMYIPHGHEILSSLLSGCRQCRPLLAINFISPYGSTGKYRCACSQHKQQRLTKRAGPVVRRAKQLMSPYIVVYGIANFVQRPHFRLLSTSRLKSSRKKISR